MKVLVIGASGLVGGECLRIFSAEPGFQVAGSYFSFPLPALHQIDTLQPDALDRWAEEHFLPDLLIQCGALTHVDRCEQYPEESFRLTVQAHRNILAFCKRHGVRMVAFSTDYVFDGRSGPYREEDPVHPLSVYGRHKLIVEEETLEAEPRHLVLRITNVYGREIRGKNFVARLLWQIKQNKPITLRLPVDQYSTPTCAADIAAAALLLVKEGQSGIFHIAGTDYMNRVELALTVLRICGYTNYDLEALPTHKLGQPAPRPLFGGLIAHKFKERFPQFIFSSVAEFVKNNKDQKTD
ncbi:MAG: SDR family oxidoreductase [Flavobacteriales bacterium]|nr:SDR family oxidoreductase [Flavobacteriales bacterium]MCX7769059.1 SDR family oxidoreductase [Flavobacteriales bacterium]MDW8410334.1 SDR family oxidoreductase [Flavobacteriales bacterium]